ncbi:hypothetical protein NFHSH190041_36870 (plasmid) [Shewanella sp. NFH-SH190041]|uniref:gpW family protein n=1 Tax=Shewanella sp. NFH-SH190041 TaxID=2950245 RepID=UPI0021C4839D|nr:gpW family protein [Shewanella sp. NFH-SH190041]BDM66235.1 hypothetical protein NFHSH190041_36870 [Shewanella sp. NFH-SH190041]
MTNQQKIIEAEAALHQLLTGAKVVQIQRNGQTVQFQQTNKSELQMYINQLRHSRCALGGLV